MDSRGGRCVHVCKINANQRILRENLRESLFVELPVGTTLLFSVYVCVPKPPYNASPDQKKQLDSVPAHAIYYICALRRHSEIGVRESAKKSAASAASPDYVKSQAVNKSAASAASLCGGRASGRLHRAFLRIFWPSWQQKISKNVQNLQLCLITKSNLRSVDR